MRALSFVLLLLFATYPVFAEYFAVKPEVANVDPFSLSIDQANNVWFSSGGEVFQKTADGIKYITNGKNPLLLSSGKIALYCDSIPAFFERKTGITLSTFDFQAINYGPIELEDGTVVFSSSCDNNIVLGSGNSFDLFPMPFARDEWLLSSLDKGFASREVLASFYHRPSRTFKTFKLDILTGRCQAYPLDDMVELALGRCNFALAKFKDKPKEIVLLRLFPDRFEFLESFADFKGEEFYLGKTVGTDFAFIDCYENGNRITVSFIPEPLSFLGFILGVGFIIRLRGRH